jgi:hypothetical protein
MQVESTVKKEAETSVMQLPAQGGQASPSPPSHGQEQILPQNPEEAHHINTLSLDSHLCNCIPKFLCFTQLMVMVT